MDSDRQEEEGFDSRVKGAARNFSLAVVKAAQRLATLTERDRGLKADNDVRVTTRYAISRVRSFITRPSLIRVYGLARPSPLD